jgi:hypothetical protein
MNGLTFNRWNVNNFPLSANILMNMDIFPNISPSLKLPNNHRGRKNNGKIRNKKGVLEDLVKHPQDPRMHNQIQSSGGSSLSSK